MKISVFLVFLFGAVKLTAQTGQLSDKTPGYIIQLTLADSNMLKGTLMEVRDSSLAVYPGKPKELNANKPYKPIPFNYTNIGEIRLQKKNARVNGTLIGGGIGLSLFAASLLFKNSGSNKVVAVYTFPIIAVAAILGTVIGSKRWKKYKINSDLFLYQSFKNTVQ